MVGLQGLQQPEDQIDTWQRAWDEVTDLHLEGKEVQAYTDMAKRRGPMLGGILGKTALASANTEIYPAE